MYVCVLVGVGVFSFGSFGFVALQHVAAKIWLSPCALLDCDTACRHAYMQMRPLPRAQHRYSCRSGGGAVSNLASRGAVGMAVPSSFRFSSSVGELPYPWPAKIRPCTSACGTAPSVRSLWQAQPVKYTCKLEWWGSQPHHHVLEALLVAEGAHVVGVGKVNLRVLVLAVVHEQGCDTQARPGSGHVPIRFALHTHTHTHTTGSM